MHVAPHSVIETDCYGCLEEGTGPPGTVLLNEREFTHYRWLDLPVQERLAWIGGLKEVLDDVAAILYADPDPARTPRKQPVGFWQEPAPPGNKRHSH